MTVISRFYGILIKMYFGDHVPPSENGEGTFKKIEPLK